MAHTRLRMKIGIDARMFSDQFTGIGRYTYELTKRFFEERQETHWVIFLNQPEYDQFEFPDHVRKVLVNARHYSFAEQTRFWRILEKEQCDLVHFTHFNVPFLYRRPFVVTIHDTTISYYPGKKMNTWYYRLGYNLVIKHALKQAQHIITVSENTKQDVEKLFGTSAEKLTTIHNGLGEEFQKVSEEKQTAIRKKYGLEKPFLLYTGNWREHKNLVRLLEAFKELQTNTNYSVSDAGYELVITGKPDPYYPEVLATVQRLELTEKVKLPGLVSSEDLVALYSAADLFVCPSLYEGFGFPPLEAMACGTPTVVSRISSLPEVCGEASVYFDPHKASDMAEKIAQVLGDEALQASLISKGTQQIQKFSWDRCAQETLAVLEK